MLRKSIRSIGGLMMSAAIWAESAQAQTSGYVAPPPVAVDTPTAVPYGVPEGSPLLDAGVCGRDDCLPGVWFEMDYLLWWLSASPSPQPIVTTGSLLDPNPGLIGQPGTRVLLGDDTVGNNPFNGIRLAAGTWWDEARSIGYEGSGFTLERRRNFEGVGSDPNGNPLLVRPFVNTQTNQQTGILVAFPGFQTGAVTSVNSTRLCGWDFNVAINGTETGDFRADGLVGVRCMYLSESMDNLQTVTALVNQGPPNTAALQQGERLSVRDFFQTQSNFYGGQLGGRMTWRGDRLTTTATVKVGIGVTDQIAELDGVATPRNDAGQFIPSGYFVNSGNQGKYYTSHFTIMPELSLNMSYRVWKSFWLRAGYDVVYWSSVVRPGNVRTPSLNPAIIPNLQGFGVGPTDQPRATLDTTDFWAQGLNLGFEFRF